MNLKYVIPLAHPRGNIKSVVCIGFRNNLPPGSNSALSSIYLAIIKSEVLKCNLYEKVLETIISDVVILKQSGIHGRKLSKTVKGTIQCVVTN